MSRWIEDAPDGGYIVVVMRSRTIASGVNCLRRKME